MKALYYLTWILLVIGGLNWLLFGLFKWDIGQLFGGMDALISRVIYVLVGLSALYLLFARRPVSSPAATAPSQVTHI